MTEFSMHCDGLLRFRTRMCIPDEKEIWKEIFSKAHNTKLTIHLESIKMYKNLQKSFWWRGMKKDIAEYVSRYLTCQRVKIEHQRPGGLLQPPLILEWK